MNTNRMKPRMTMEKHGLFLNHEGGAMNVTKWLAASIVCITLLISVSLYAEPADVDRQIDLVEQLLDAGVTEGVGEAVDGLSKRDGLTDNQRGMLHVLRGRLAERLDRDKRARGQYLTARRLYPETEADLAAAIRLAMAHRRQRETNEAAVLLESALRRHGESPRRSEAELLLIDLTTRGDQRVAALREFLGKRRNAPSVAKARQTLAAAIENRSGGPTAESVTLRLAVLEATPDSATGREALARLEALPDNPAPAQALEALADGLGRLTGPDAPYRRRLAMLRIETGLARGRLIERIDPTLKEAMAGLRRVIDDFEKTYADVPGRGFAARARVRTHLIVGERAALQRDVVAAMKPLAEARRMLHAMALGLAKARPADYDITSEIDRLGRIYEAVEQSELAWATWRLLHRLRPASAEGRNALHRAAELQAGAMGDPAGAIDTFALYGAMYPPSSEIDRQQLIDEVRQFGFESVAEFQAAAGLDVDGLVGPNTWDAIRRWEETFRDVLPPRPQPGIHDGGRYVHDRIYTLAERLRREGRFREAARGYRTFVALYPRNRKADEALANIAAIFIDTGLFREALGVCREMIDDFPKGRKTRRAHLDAALCHENLGQWKKAAEYYALFLKKYPHDDRVAEVKARTQAVEDILPYQRLIDDGPPADKLAEARYDVGKILYERLKDLDRAAEAFARVGAMEVKHYRVPEALFMVGTIRLHQEQFPAAREAFAELVRRFEDSRLADDGQFWIGHTYEYHARAIGKLDRKAIVLRRRAFGERRPLIEDSALRRLYNPDIAPGAGADLAPRDGLALAGMTDSSERVKLLLGKAIEAYNTVAARFPEGDMAERALWRIGVVRLDYLEEPEAGMAAFERLLTTYPGTRYGQEAQFKVGSHYLEAEQFARAREAFERYVFAYPNSDKVQQATMNVARCFEGLGQWDEALDRYRRYLNKYPDGAFAEQAKQKVDWIKRFRF